MKVAVLLGATVYFTIAIIGGSVLACFFAPACLALAILTTTQEARHDDR